MRSRRVRKLLSELERLTHDGRMQRMVDLGREAGRDKGAAAILADLEQGSAYERMLALQAVYGSRDGTVAARALRAPSRFVRWRAIGPLAIAATDDVVVAALDEAPRSLRLTAIRRLRRRRRHRAIDRLLEQLAIRNDHELPALLPFASAETVVRFREKATERGGTVFWLRLARHHPALAADWVAALARRDGAHDYVVRRAARTVLPVLARRFPDHAAKLAEVLATRFPVEVLDWSDLAKTRPSIVARILADSDDAYSRYWGLSLRGDRMDDETRRTLLERRPAAFARPGRWLTKLAGPARVAAVEAAGMAWRDRVSSAVPPAILETLPPAVRHAEARRHLALPTLAASPTSYLPYAGLLPWSECAEVATSHLGHADASIRAVALEALGGAVRFEGGHLGDYLALVAERANEQDPVRLVMLRGLANIPTRAFGAEHLDAIGEVFTSALAATDLSTSTVAEAQRLVIRLLPRHREWAAKWFVRLVRESGQVLVPGLASRLRADEARDLCKALTPVIGFWNRSERDAALLRFLDALGHHVRPLGDQHALLERIARESRNSWHAEQALGVLRDHVPARHAALVPVLLHDDASWGVLGGVYRFLHRRRQDLLTPYLGGRRFRGRFDTGAARFVLPLRSGFFRWTPAQQEQFAATLDGVIAETDRDTPAILRALPQRAALAFASTKAVEDLADDTERPAVRDAALRVMGTLDHGEGVAILVGALGDERAAVAVPALRRALLEMPDDDAVRLLRSVPRTGLRAAKEVLRLAGALQTDAAFRLLLELSEAGEGHETAHRDLRLASARACWDHLDQPESWQLIEEMARDADPVLLHGLARIPVEDLSPSALRRLAKVFCRILEHPSAEACHYVLLRLWVQPIFDPEGELLDAALARLAGGPRYENDAAAAAVAAGCRPDDAERLRAATVSLLPDRRALVALERRMGAAIVYDRARVGPVVKAVVAGLRADPLTATLVSALAVRLLPDATGAQTLRELARENLLTPDALQAAMTTMTRIAGEPVGRALDDLESDLAEEEDDLLRRLGLAALEARASDYVGQGWSDARLARLRAYRADPSPVVAGAAQFILPKEELTSTTREA